MMSNKNAEVLMKSVADSLAATVEISEHRLFQSIQKACAVIGHISGYPKTQYNLVEQFLETISERASDVLNGRSPQALEDCLYRRFPDTPLDERTLRHAWMLLSDELARTGDRPEHSSTETIESWVSAGVPTPWPHVGIESALEKVLSLVGQGQQVVVLTGPGRTAFLAACRRRLLAEKAGCYPAPVFNAARDDAGHLIDLDSLPDGLNDALSESYGKIHYNEDRLGMLGRIGCQFPVALLLDDVDFSSRTVLYGLPVFLEPDPNRNALLVCSMLSTEGQIGPFADIIEDADKRGMLTRIELPVLSAELAGDALSQIDTQLEGDSDLVGTLLADACPSHGGESLRWAAFGSWLSELIDLTPDERAEHLRTPVDMSKWMPAHPLLKTLLSVGSVEGLQFHGAAVGAVLEKSEDEIEDLIQDDEMEVDGEVVGGCLDAVPMNKSGWQTLKDGAQAVYEFADARFFLALNEAMDSERLKTVAQALLESLWELHGPAHFWQSTSSFRRLASFCDATGHLQRGLLSGVSRERVETGFRRLLPVLNHETNYHLGLARLYGASMEVGGASIASGQASLADQAFQAAAAAAQKLQRVAAAGEAMARLGEIRLALALPEPAKAALDVAEQLLGGTDATASLQRIALLKAEVAVLEGDIASAIDVLSLSVAELLNADDQAHAALALMRLGRIRYESGDTAMAVDELDRAIQVAAEAADPRARAAAHAAKGFIHSEQNELNPAFERLNDAAQAFQSVGLPITILETIAADLQRRNGQPAEAEKRFAAVADAFKKSRAAIQWADAQHGVARCKIDQENYTDASKVLDQVEQLRVRARDRFGLVRVFLDHARCKAGAKDYIPAFRYACMARILSERAGLGLHLDPATKLVIELVPHLDDAADVTTRDIGQQAEQAINAIETVWNAPPQPTEGSSELH